MEMSTRKRKDRRREAMRLHLIEVAERLFAEHGLAGVSLRQIGAAAGSANLSVVSYYFGAKEGLLRAIFEQRRGELDLARAALLQKLRDAGLQNDPRALLEALYLPLALQRDHDGRRSYAAFVGGLNRLNQFTSSLALAETPAPAMNSIVDLLRASVPHLSDRTFERRQRLTLMLVCEALGLLDAAADRLDAKADAEAFHDILDMVAAGLCAPLGKGPRLA